MAAGDPIASDRIFGDLLQFARIEVESHDLEPWAEVLAAAADIGGWDRERTHWAIRAYNTFDGLAAGMEMVRRWPTPDAWAIAGPDEKATISDLACAQERRGLRAGRAGRCYDSYLEQLAGLSQDIWMGLGLGPGGFHGLVRHLRTVWGVGRQSAYEWAEFLAKVLAAPVEADDAMLWESKGPRRSLQRLYGQPNPTSAWLDDRATECRAWLADQGVALDWWDFETVICDFNVMRDGRYYPGRHLAALREEIAEAPAGPDRDTLEAAWEKAIPEPWRSIDPGIDKRLTGRYRDTGRIATTW